MSLIYRAKWMFVCSDIGWSVVRQKLNCFTDEIVADSRRQIKERLVWVVEK